MNHLYGRDREIRRVSAFLDDAVDGGRGALLVEGPLGSGKSSVLVHAAALAEARGTEVVRCPATDLALRAGRRPGPYLYLIDDLDVCAPAALAALFAREAPALREAAGVLAALNPLRGAAHRQVLLDAFGNRLECLRLDPLGPAAVRKLAAELVGGVPGPALRERVGAAGGNPRLIVELVRGLGDTGETAADGTAGRRAGAAVPAGVRSVVRRMVEELSPETTQLVRAGALLGQVFSVPAVAALLRSSSLAVLSAVDEAVLAGILREQEDGLVFVHPVVREVVGDAIPPAVRKAILAESPHVSWDRVRPSGCRSGGPAASTDRQRQPRPSDADDEDGVVGAVRTLLSSGYPESAALLAGTAIDRSPTGTEERGLRGVVSDVAAMMHEAGPRPDDVPREPEEVLSELAAREGLDRAGAGRLRVAAACALSNLDWGAGDLSGALRWGRGAAEESDVAVPGGRRIRARLALAWKLTCLGEYYEAEWLIEQCREALAREPRTSPCPAPDIQLAALRLRTGHPGTAAELAAEALRKGLVYGNPSYTVSAAVVLAQARIQSGDVVAAGRVLDRHAGTAEDRCLAWPARRLWTVAVQRAACGDVDGAAAAIGPGGSGLGDLRGLMAAEPAAAAWIVRFARATGRENLARTAVRTAESLSSRNPGIRSTAAAAQHARSLFDGDGTGLARAAETHIEAWAASSARHDLGRLRTPGGPVGMPASMERLIDTRGEPGEEGPWTDAAPSADVPAEPGTPRSVLTMLGDTERAIAVLVADGLTNREVAKRVCLSPHTINYYLRRIYRTLGIRSRTELAAHVHSGARLRVS
ncbi:LuxR family transcriptional regulator [Streptomyces macrosporus]|uniref:LuxR family transcriptional regulator n=1 Tax=Streptomyces macrosporus TaxID=44032 RepID=A0ABP5XSZ8_9ACTN